jgi:hypothetical protein
VSNKISVGIRRPAARRAASAAVFSLVVAADASAMEFNTGVPDLSTRWDNTVLYNLAVRAQGRNPLIGNDAIADEGDYRFNNGQIVSDRIDLLSEMDVSYKKMTGFRVSGAGWYDFAYSSHSSSNPNTPFDAIPSYPGFQYTGHVKRFYHAGGELLDAFTFGNFMIGSVPVSVKAGRDTIYWGESLLLGGALNGISYSQMPIDLQRGFAIPGIEAKELFLPLTNVAVQSQLTDSLSVFGQYFLQWQSYRYPEGGTYLGPVDFAFDGPVRQYLNSKVGFAERGGDVKPASTTGEWGLGSRWSPGWLDGTVGLYYRHFADKLPQAFITTLAPANGSVYNLIYPKDIDLWGLSLAKEIAGISFGAEVSYRRNTPLNSTILGIAGGGTPGDGQTPGARGNTLHGVLNAVGIVNKTPVFDTANWTVEFTGSQYEKVTSGQNLFFAVGNPACAGKDKWDGCSTRNYLGVAANFTPTWFQVFPAVDLLMPLSYSRGLSGNAATVFAGNQANGNYSGGFGADVDQRYRFDLKYTGFFGQVKSNGTAVTSQNGFTTLLKDRGYVSLTFKTTF